MDIILIAFLAFFIVLAYTVSRFARSAVKQTNRGYQNMDEANAIRKENVELQKEILKELKEIKNKMG
ncbi:hypothetical protein GLW03_16810 [Halobacillus halophilus]|uniref:hypothetical protein n=1 Tax=Halobacillus halophilus TaxID=1570 RepID=UPI0013698A57|nr:hypothetical protein [Halobacillus halophilus]MYL31480.1 hypothetical protein [Halobacillus halophilus]